MNRAAPEDVKIAGMRIAFERLRTCEPSRHHAPHISMARRDPYPNPQLAAESSCRQRLDTARAMTIEPMVSPAGLPHGLVR
jgi:hypothetical protein